MVRFMKAGDIEQVLDIENRCFSTPWSKEVFQKGLKNKIDFYWVYEENDKILGYLNLMVVEQEGELNKIAVLPEVQKRGYAQKLMEKMGEFSFKNQLFQITLEVRKSNERARKLYKFYGFQEISVRKNYYCFPTEDGIIMQRH